MTPPEAPEDGTATQRDMPPAVSVCLTVLKNRSDFLRAARAFKHPTRGMIVQGRRRVQGEADGVRVGFTCSKKVGNAVARNRAKRRLREVARVILPQHGREGWDYVLIGRAEVTADRRFDDLLNDLIKALAALHASETER